MRIALVNDHRWIAPSDPDDYTRRILTEDRILGEAFGDVGAAVERVDWADPDAAWHRFDAVLIRQVWDYFERFDEFRDWLDRIEDAARVVNPVEIVRWNVDKRYLVDLAEAGVPVVPTRVVRRTVQPPTLADLLDEAGLEVACIKPAVSGAGRATYRLRRADAGAMQATWRRLAVAEDMLVQPFMPAIVETGETSLMVIDGVVTHAVRKIAAPGEFRVQDDHGGSVHRHAPTAAEIAVAERAMDAIPGTALYARVDLVDGGSGPLLMELELIEPELFFRHRAEAAARLARAVVHGSRGKHFAAAPDHPQT